MRLVFFWDLVADPAKEFFRGCVVPHFSDCVVYGFFLCGEPFDEEEEVWTRWFEVHDSKCDIFRGPYASTVEERLFLFFCEAVDEEGGWVSVCGGLAAWGAYADAGCVRDFCRRSENEGFQSALVF